MFGYPQVWQVTGDVWLFSSVAGDWRYLVIFKSGRCLEVFGYLQVCQVTGGVWLSSSVAGDWRCLVIFKCGR